MLLWLVSFLLSERDGSGMVELAKDEGQDASYDEQTTPDDP